MSDSDSDNERLPVMVDIGYTSADDAERIHRERVSRAGVFSNTVIQRTVKRSYRGRPSIGEDEVLAGINMHSGLQTPQEAETARYNGDIREQFVVDALQQQRHDAIANGDSHAAAVAMKRLEHRYKRRRELGLEPIEPKQTD